VSRNRLDALAFAFADVVIRLRWFVVFAALALCAWAGTGIRHLEYSNNYRVFFSKQNPELAAFEEFQKVYTKSDNILFVLAPKGDGAFSRDTLRAVAEITDAGWQAPFARRVDSITNFQRTYAVGDELIVEDLIGDIGALSDGDLAEKERIALAEPLLNGQLITADARVTAVNIVFNFPEEQLSEVPDAVAYARALRDRVEAAHPGLDIYLTGTSMLNTAFSEASVADYKFLIPVMFLIIIVVTALSVKSVGATFATVLIIALSAVVGMGWAGFAGIKLAGPSPSAPIVILTLAVADSIHILVTARDGMRNGLTKRAALIDSLAKNFMPVFVTSLTTAVGFLALNFSDSPPFRDLGNITAVGVTAAWALSITLLPALVAILPLSVKPAGGDGRGKALIEAFGDFVVAHHRFFFVVTGIAAVALIACIPRIVLSDRFRTYFDERIEFRRDSDAAIEYFGFNIMEFNVPAGGPGAVSDPEFLKRVDAFTAWLRAQPNVTHVYSLTDIMKRLNRNMNGDDPAFYRLPEDRELAAQYLLLFELSLPYGLDLNDRIDIDKSATRVTATLDGNMRTPEIRAFLKESREWLRKNAPEQETQATGPQVLFTFIAERNIRSMVGGQIATTVAMGLIMIVTLRSLYLGFLSLIPNALPVLAAFGAWAILVGEVGFSVAVISSISTGLVIDDTTHFLMKFRRGMMRKGLSVKDAIRYSFAEVAAPILFTTIIIAAGFFVLTFSAFKILAEMGLLTSLTITLALLFDLFFLPGLLIMLVRDKRAKGVSA